MYILASKSPRRKELLKQIIDEFEIIVPDIDESSVKEDPFLLSERLSYLKAQKIFKSHPDDIVIAADTIVIHNSKVLGKPKDEHEAYMMLSQLSDDVHYVVTGYTICSKEKVISHSVITKVYFNKLNDELILKYIETRSPFDKAGGYGIQDIEFNLIKKIQGSYNNVVGLPIEEIKLHL